jgi:hypothetical protein
MSDWFENWVKLKFWNKKLNQNLDIYLEIDLNVIRNRVIVYMSCSIY